MTHLSVELDGQLGDFHLSAAFQAEPGVSALFGPSGAGKSLILRAIAGLWTPQSGAIKLASKRLLDTASRHNIPAHQRNIGIVVQQPLLFPHMSVEQNLRYGMAQPDGSITSLLKMLDIAPLLERMPRNLSGGEAQRVAIGRALLAEPELLLLDEPLTGLDDERRNQVLPYLQRLWQETGVSILYVSHRRDEILALAKTVFVVDQGKVSASMTVDAFAETGGPKSLGDI